MRIIYFDERTERPLAGVATVGFFDGVHLGHRHLIGKVVSLARRARTAATVVTFERHPRQVLQPGWRPQLLSTLGEKVALLESTGIDQLVVLRFDAAMAALPAAAFMRDVLSGRLGVSTLVTGYDNHFGHREQGSTEGFDDYVRYGAAVGIDVVCGDAFDAGTVRVSSSVVRRLLSAGRVAEAASCLGRPYSLSGTVVGGYHVGTAMGFPTANLQVADADKLVPARGAYAVRVAVDGGALLPGMMNIGVRPTFAGDTETLEVNLIGFSGDLYGRELTVSFVDRLRAEMKFDSRESLARQLAADARRAELILAAQDVATGAASQ